MVMTQLLYGRYFSDIVGTVGSDANFAKDVTLTKMPMLLKEAQPMMLMNGLHIQKTLQHT